MGRGAGNLCTELLVQYINEHIENRYDIVPLLEIVDEYIKPEYSHFPWGYSVPYYISAIYQCHPNYATHLLNKQTLTIKDINMILRQIVFSQKTLYNAHYIETLYLRYQQHYVDDTQTLNELKNATQNKAILILAPGHSLKAEEETINTYIKTIKPIVFSVNFVPKKQFYHYLFVSNLKRFKAIKGLIQNIASDKKMILTSNITVEFSNNVFIADYSSYLTNDATFSDSAGLMLLNLLKMAGVKKVTLAGFDGFSSHKTENFYDTSLMHSADGEALLKQTEIIKEHIKKLQMTINITFLTKSHYSL